MCKRPAWARLRAGFLPLVFSLAAALSLASCSWFTPVSGGTTSISPGVLVTEQGFVTLLDQQSGKQIWRRQTNVTDFLPLLSNDMVYIVSQNPGGYNPDRTDTLEALSLASGKLVWRWNWPEHWTPENAPTISDGIVYLSESSLPANANYSPAPLSEYQGFVVALRASDGQQLWQVALPGLLSPATVANGTVYVTNGLAVLALRRSDGQQLWQHQPDAAEDLSYYTSMQMQQRQQNVLIVQGSQVYVEMRRMEGNQSVYDLVALDTRTGREVWRFQSHGVMLPPFFSHDIFYIAYNAIPGGSYVVALSAARGSVLWTYHIAVYFALSQPVLVGSVLYESEIATDLTHTSSVVTLRATDGSVLRRYIPHSGQLMSMPVVSQHMLYLGEVLAGTRDRSAVAVVALDLATGAEVWHSSQLQPFGGVVPVVSRGYLYAFSPWDYAPDTLVVLRASNGSRLWSYPTQGWIYNVVTDF
jgi:outer membrane protein assembly factor BamB